MVRFVPVAQAIEDGQRFLRCRFTDHDRLEPALQRRVLFDVFPVLVQRRRADALDLTPGQRRFEDICRVEAALGRTGSDDRMDLVNEQQHVPGLVELIHDVLQTLFKLTPVLRPGHHAADVQAHHPFPEQQLRHVHDLAGAGHVETVRLHVFAGVQTAADGDIAAIQGGAVQASGDPDRAMSGHVAFNIGRSGDVDLATVHMPAHAQTAGAVHIFHDGQIASATAGPADMHFFAMDRPVPMAAAADVDFIILAAGQPAGTADMCIICHDRILL